MLQMWKHISKRTHIKVAKDNLHVLRNQLDKYSNPNVLPTSRVVTSLAVQIQLKRYMQVTGEKLIYKRGRFYTWATSQITKKESSVHKQFQESKCTQKNFLKPNLHTLMKICCEQHVLPPAWIETNDFHFLCKISEDQSSKINSIKQNPSNFYKWIQIQV